MELSLRRTKGSVEAEISKALTQWEKDSLFESKEGLLTIKVITFHTDRSTRTGERVMVFRLANNLEKMFSA